MKNLKKLFFFFFILFAFSFSVGEDSKVILDRQREPAKLKIGVTKIKSKELPLEFNGQTKRIYGEIDITDSEVIFISESLDEIPSLTTVNGRKSINNIKRYLTKNIKIGEKFTYQIKEDEKNNKKYLLIDCKVPLKQIYIYIVEKNTYRLKKVYRGVFKQVYSLRRNIDYGSLNINENHKLDIVRGQISFSNGKVLLNGKESTVLELKGEYPKKATAKPDTEIGRLKESYRIGVENFNGQISYSSVKELKGNSETLINQKVNLRNSKGEDVGTLKLYSSDNKEFLDLEIEILNPYDDIKNKIKIEYGCANLGLGNFKTKFVDTFSININKKVPTGFPANTKGELLIPHGEQIALQEARIRTNESGDLTINNKIVPSNEKSGKFLKKIDFNNGNLDFKNGERIIKLETYYKENKDPIVNEINFGVTGNVPSDYKFENIDMKDIYGLNVGKMQINSLTNNDYFEIMLSNWKTIHSYTANLINIQYISRKDGKDTILKEDTFKIIVKPMEEVIPSNTFGTLTIENIKDLEFTDFYVDKNNKLQIAGNRFETHFDVNNASYSGILPRNIKTNVNSNNPYEGYWIDWGEKGRVLIESTDGWSHINDNFDYRDGGFHTGNGNDGWKPLKNTKGDKIGYVYISCNGKDANKDSITIGFEPLSPLNVFDKFDLKGASVNTRYTFSYQALIGGQWITKKKDVLYIMIQNGINQNSGEIKLSNPLVYYDKNTSTAVSNIVHDKRVHLAGNESITLSRTGNIFRKNTDLMGDEWINSKNIPEYDWQIGKHKMVVSKGSNLEIRKETDENGKTISSTFISGNNNSNSSKNQVMFSYDGGNKYLNFGLSKYNFEGEIIQGINIIHYGKGNTSIQSKDEYKIIIPKFDGLCYVNPGYDIKPDEEYTKNYSFDKQLGTGELIMDYGTVGFRDLDTRITHQSGGKGIELRCIKNVVIRSVENPKYFMYGELYFDGQDVKTDKGGAETYFTGKNEKETYKMLKLKIDTQEKLVPKEKFVILTTDGKCPLKVGVNVNGNTEKYFTPVCGIESDNPDLGKELYLQVMTKRFLETEIIFENPNLNVLRPDGKPIENSKYMNWIALSKSDYPQGFMKDEVNHSNFWGRVKGDIIDIPVRAYGDAKEDFIKISMFEKSETAGQMLSEDIVVPNQGAMDTSNNMDINAKISLNDFNGGKSVGRNSNFVIRQQKEKNFLEFSLDNGYDPINDVGKSKTFYLRYTDGKTGEFLFDQRITVKIRDAVNFKSDTTITFKNPTMSAERTNDNGRIKFENLGEALGENNDNIKLFDKIKWYTVAGATKYTDFINSIPEFRKINRPGVVYPKEFYRLENGNLILGLPDNRENFARIFGSNYTGDRMEAQFELRFDQNDEKVHRINFILEEFDPRYFGKVYPSGVSQIKGENYKEINEVGSGIVHLGKNPKLDANGNIVVDLGTKYRDYSRYPSLVEKYLNKQLEVGMEQNIEVDVIPKADTGIKAKEFAPIKGKLVFVSSKGETLSKKIIKTIGNGMANTQEPESYDLKLILTPVEYRKLESDTEYELFLNGKKDIISIGVLGDKKFSKKIIFNKPLNFITEGPSLIIIPEVLNFGVINLQPEKDEILKEVNQSANIRVEIDENTLSPDFKTNLVTDVQEIMIYKRTLEGGKVQNGQPLKVKNINLTKNTPQNGQQTKTKIENYTISGTLEVPLYENVGTGRYSGVITVTFTYE